MNKSKLQLVWWLCMFPTFGAMLMLSYEWMQHPTETRFLIYAIVCLVGGVIFGSLIVSQSSGDTEEKKDQGSPGGSVEQQWTRESERRSEPAPNWWETSHPSFSDAVMIAAESKSAEAIPLGELSNSAPAVKAVPVVGTKKLELTISGGAAAAKPELREAAYVEAAKAESGKAEPVKPEAAAGVEAAKAEEAKAEAARVGAAKAELAAKAAAARAELAAKEPKAEDSAVSRLFGEQAESDLDSAFARMFGDEAPAASAESQKSDIRQKSEEKKEKPTPVIPVAEKTVEPIAEKTDEESALSRLFGDDPIPMSESETRDVMSELGLSVESAAMSESAAISEPEPAKVEPVAKSSQAAQKSEADDAFSRLFGDEPVAEATELLESFEPPAEEQFDPSRAAMPAVDVEIAQKMVARLEAEVAKAEVVAKKLEVEVKKAEPMAARLEVAKQELKQDSKPAGTPGNGKPATTSPGNGTKPGAPAGTASSTYANANSTANKAQSKSAAMSSSSGKPLPELKDVEEYFTLGEKLMAEENYDLAIKCYERITKMDTRNFDGWYLRGIALRKNGRIDEALYCFNYSVGINDKSPLAHSERADCLLSAKKAEQALIAYDKSLSLDKVAPKSWLGKARCMALMGKHKDAVACYDKVLAMQPANEDAKKERLESAARVPAKA